MQWAWSSRVAACALATLASSVVVVATGCGGADGTIGGVAEPVDPEGAPLPFSPAEGVEGESDGDDPGFVAFDPRDPTLPGGGADPDDRDEPAEPPLKPVERLDAESDRQLAVMKSTVYQHTTEIDESTGTFKYDCSGFVGYALARVLPDRLESVKAWNGVKRPLAKHYTNFFASIDPGKAKSGWTRVARAIDLVPGDVVAWLKPADMVSANTGHVMIVRAAPKQNPARADEVLVPITDSTASPHGATDSRWSEGHGLGTGTIGLLVDAKGAPVKYRWNGGTSTTIRTTLIALGRPE